MSEEDRERLDTVRGVISAVVGAVLVIYGAVAAPPNRAVIICLGLVLLGVLAISAVLPVARKRGPG